MKFSGNVCEYFEDLSKYKTAGYESVDMSECSTINPIDSSMTIGAPNRVTVYERIP